MSAGVPDFADAREYMTRLRGLSEPLTRDEKRLIHDVLKLAQHLCGGVNRRRGTKLRRRR